MRRRIEGWSPKWEYDVIDIVAPIGVTICRRDVCWRFYSSFIKCKDMMFISGLSSGEV